MNDLILPLYKNGFLSTEANLFFALVMGITFGFALERTGFTRSKHIAGTFYFTNIAVPKIMGEANMQSFDYLSCTVFD